MACGRLHLCQSEEERRQLQLGLQVMLWEVEAARKYKLTPSALIMISRLMPEQSQGIIETLPSTGQGLRPLVVWTDLEWDGRWFPRE